MTNERAAYEAARAEFQRQVNEIPNANALPFDDLFPITEALRAELGLDALCEAARKTMQGWREARCDLSQYLQPGDLVDEEMYDYFLCVLPPAYCSSSIVQVGEPVFHGERGATFDTLKRTADGWMYCGACYIRQTEAVPYVRWRERKGS